MRSSLLSAAAVALSFAGTAIADLDPIVIKGSHFFYKSNGTEFFIRGVAYQQQFSGSGPSTSGGSSQEQLQYTDPLSDATQCARDIPELVGLRTNTIRTYAIDPTKNHDECMKALADAGIYVVTDLSEPATSINRNDPQWNIKLYNRYTSVIDVMSKYSNTLGFFAGNEVSNAVNNTAASAYVKAAVRDMKSYIQSKKYRTMGVGYAANDDAAIRVPLEQYFNCGPAESSIDFFGYNIYSWCGDSSYTKSGYDVRTKEFSTYNIPAFFAEYGCNDPAPRKFTEVGTLFGSQMTPVWSGGIVYMYFQEANNYGTCLLTIPIPKKNALLTSQTRPGIGQRQQRQSPPRLLRPLLAARIRDPLRHRRGILQPHQLRRLVPDLRRRLGRRHRPPSNSQPAALLLHVRLSRLRRQAGHLRLLAAESLLAGLRLRLGPVLPGDRVERDERQLRRVLDVWAYRSAVACAERVL